MNKKVLEECKKYLIARYAWLYGNNDFEFSSDINSKFPSWLYVDMNDLAKKVKNESDEITAGLVADPDIGVLFYMIPYVEGQDIKAKMSNAIKIRSQLLPDSNLNPKKEILDEAGSWRVILCWLLDDSGRDEWIQAISTLRRDTAYLEEIPVDSIAIRHEVPWDSVFNDYAFPRLLFQTRKALSMSSIEESFKWVSADETVKSTLQDFPDNFTDTDQKHYAEEIRKKVSQYKSTETENKSPAVSKPMRLKSIDIRNIRNIKNLEISYPTNIASSIILHGPNGTGKSSIFEAISMNVCGTSNRFDVFLRDSDIKAKDKARLYIDDYLKPKQGDGSSPKVGLNGELSELELVDSMEDSQLGLRDMSGTLISQEYSAKFSEYNSSQLAAVVLGEYSDLSNILNEHIQSQYDEANRKRKTFLNQYGLRSYIKQKDTARNRIAQEILKKEIPQAIPTLTNWIKRICDMSKEDIDGMKSLYDKWIIWYESKSPAQKAEAFLSTEEIHSVIFEHLTNYHSLYKKTEVWISNFYDDYLSGIEDASSIIEKINTWGKWLETQKGTVDQIDKKELKRVEQELKTDKQKQADIIRDGKILRTRLDHHNNLDEILDDWIIEHPNECITCGTDLTDKKGLKDVVDNLKELTRTRRSDLLKKNEDISKKISKLQEEYDKYVPVSHPLSSSERSTVMRPFLWLLKDEDAFSEYIMISENREKAIALLNRMRQVPELQEPKDIQEESSRIADDIITAFKEYDFVAKNPDDWSLVKKKYMDKAGSVVKDHLPMFLGALWIELALNMTTAPWLLPAKFQLSVETQVSGHKVSINTENGLLAKHLFNCSELHIFGIGWFFAQYLTRGRFNNNFMVMDDPAQEMDETTFRDICRLWETFIRLHRKQSIPLSMLVMLHQESRAMDAARATNGQLYILGWDKSQQETQDHHTVEHVKLIGEQFKPVKPTKIYQS